MTQAVDSAPRLRQVQKARHVHNGLSPRRLHRFQKHLLKAVRSVRLVAHDPENRLQTAGPYSSIIAFQSANRVPQVVSNFAAVTLMTHYSSIALHQKPDNLFNTGLVMERRHPAAVFKTSTFRHTRMIITCLRHAT